MEMLVLPRLDETSTESFWKHYLECLPKGMKEYDPTVDYMGPKGKRLSKIISRFISEIDCNEAAFRHDFFYTIGGNEHARYDTDKTFLLEMRVLIKAVTKNRLKRFYCNRRAKARYLGVRAGGWSCWTQSQYLNTLEQETK